MILLCLLMSSLVGDEPLMLGSGQPWYEQEKTAPQTMEGILDYQSTTGRIGIPASYSPFRFIRKVEETGKIEQYALHCPGLEAVLAANVGQRVNVEGKFLSKGEGDQKQTTIWVGKISILGTAPMNVFTELRSIARTEKLQTYSGLRGQALGTLVLRSAKEVAQVTGQGQGPDAEREAVMRLCGLFGIKAIDWKTQMVVHIGPTNQTRMSNRKMEITKIEVHERGATVYWKNDEFMKLNAAPSSDTLLVPRVDGEITFKQVAGKKSNDKVEDPPVEKLIPRAPLK
ncbi:MAG: hypothetical protein U0796_06540 [Gemmatales bacterium]